MRQCATLDSGGNSSGKIGIVWGKCTLNDYTPYIQSTFSDELVSDLVTWIIAVSRGLDVGQDVL